MESRVIIFLVFASLGQRFYVLTSLDSQRKSRHQTAVLSKIRANEEAATIASLESFSTLFYEIEKLAAKLIWNLEAESDISSKITEALVKMRDAADLTLDSVQIALGKSSCSAKFALTRVYWQCAAFPHVTTALELARYGNSGGNGAAIEVQEAKVLKIALNASEKLYDLIRAYQNTTDANILAVIKSAEDGARVSALHVNNAIFNAIKYYAAAVTAGYADESLLSDIEDCRGKVIRGSSVNGEYDFGLIKTLYIISEIKQRGIVTALAANQYALTASIDRYEEGNEAFINIVRAYCIRVDLGLGDDGDDDFSRTDAASATVLAKYHAGDNLILDGFMSIYPTSTLIASAREALAIADVQIVTTLFDAIDTAVAQCGNYSETLDKIEFYRNTIISPIPGYIAEFFKVLRNNQTFDDKREAELKTLQEKSTDGLVINAQALFDAVEVLAKAIQIGKMGKNNCSTIPDLLVTANIGDYQSCVNIFDAAVIVIEAITPN